MKRRYHQLVIVAALVGCAGSTDPTHGDPWVGSWNLVTVNGLPAPANVGTTHIIRRTLLLLSPTLGPNDVTGSDVWTDSTLGTVFCPQGTPPGALCNGSGGSIGTWTASGSVVTTVTGQPLGTASAVITFTRQTDGTLLRTDGGLTEVYSR